MLWICLTCQVAMPVRVMKAMGIETLLLTNAAGGLNQDYKTGDIMLLTDHIDLPGLSGECVLIGKNDERSFSFNSYSFF